MRLSVFLFFVSALFLNSSAYAIDVGGITLNGEAAFDYNSLSSGGNPYPAVGGAQNEQYRFNSAQLTFKKETEELSLLGRLMYMPTTVTTPGGGSTSGSFGTLDQLEIYYKARPDFLIGFGRLVTTLGFESPMRSENIFYNSDVAMQGITPGYGEGMRARYNPGAYLAISLSTYNRSTYNQFGDDYTPTKTTELSATGEAGPVLWFIGYQTGTDTDGATPANKVDKTSSNAWVTYHIIEPLTWSVSYDSRTQKIESQSQDYAQSISSVLSYTLGKNVLAVRYETLLGAGELDKLSGTTGVYYSGADKVDIWSAVERYNLSEHFSLYLEYRHDGADQAVLKNNKGDLTKELHLFTLGALAHF